MKKPRDVRGAESAMYLQTQNSDSSLPPQAVPHRSRLGAGHRGPQRGGTR